MTNDNKIITGVAIKQNNTIHSLPKPNRHNDIIEKAMINYIGEREEGFVCADGSFLNRIDAGALAVKTGQVRHLQWPPKLSSVDLW